MNLSHSSGFEQEVADVAHGPDCRCLGSRTPYATGETWPVRVDQFLADGMSADEVDRWVQSAAILQPNGDGLDIAVKDGRIVGVRGRASVLLDWEMIGQAAQSIKDEQLHQLAQRCQAETTRQQKWANSKIKEASTQALVT